jgi:hypothetical protein
MPINNNLTQSVKADQDTDSVSTILEQETQSTIKDWLRRIDDENLLIDTPLEEKDRASHLPELFRELVHRLRHPLAPGTRALKSSGAVAHGLLRLRQGYTAAMLIEESRILQVSIFHTLHTNSHRVNYTLLLPDVMVIADEVDSQLAQAMRSYISAGPNIQGKPDPYYDMGIPHS